MHLGEKRREHGQTLQSLISHCALCQTSRTPRGFKELMVSTRIIEGEKEQERKKEITTMKPQGI